GSSSDLLSSRRRSRSGHPTAFASGGEEPLGGGAQARGLVFVFVFGLPSLWAATIPGATAPIPLASILAPGLRSPGPGPRGVFPLVPVLLRLGVCPALPGLHPPIRDSPGRVAQHVEQGALSHGVTEPFPRVLQLLVPLLPRLGAQDVPDAKCHGDPLVSHVAP